MNQVHIPKYPDEDNYLLKLQSRSHPIEVKCLDCPEKNHRDCDGIDKTNDHKIHTLLKEHCKFGHFVNPTNNMKFKRRYTDSTDCLCHLLPEPIMFKLAQVDDFE